MHRWTLTMWTAVGLMALSGCHGGRKPSEADLKGAIDRYLQTQTGTCVALDGQFPFDVPAGDKSHQAARLASLGQNGLVQATDTTAVVHNMANALSLGPKRAEPVKRYTVSSEGKNYFRRVAGSAGQSDGFCYGHKEVDSIVSWTEPRTQGDYSETTVTYTYRIPDLAAWAKAPEVEQAFPAIGNTLDAAGKNQSIALHLTNAGWTVNNF